VSAPGFTESRVAIVRQPSLLLYPPLPFRGEQFRFVIRREPCECGEEAVQLAGDDIRRAAETHNAGESHQAWRARR